MIIKVQIPLVSTEEVPGALIYNQDRSLMLVVDGSRRLEELVGPRKKAYFEARVVGSSIELLNKVEDQGW